MSFFDAVNLAGGLALFLYGMSAMGSGLEKFAGGKLEGILRRLTSNTLSAVLFGALITAVIQSSSATTVIVVGLVNAGIMQLSQAIGVIMGANIGTTITAQILRLSDIGSDNIFLQLLKPSTIAPILAIIGAVMFVFMKSKKANNLGQIFLGFGILFTGMFAMESAVAPLRSSPVFMHLFATLTNPILGVLVGAVVTAIIQSSSASIGILQALSSTGSITWGAAVPIILGQNIGTTVTSMLSSVGASRNARRSAIVHLYFNVIGTILFLVGIYSIKHFIGIPFWDDVITRGGIANFHTLFNITTTALFLPFTKVLAKLAYLTIPVSDEEKNQTVSDTPVLDERLLVSPPVAVQQAKSAVDTMGAFAQQNLQAVFPLFVHYQPDQAVLIEQKESALDGLEVSIDNYLVRVSDEALSETENRIVSQMFSQVTEFERIGDYAINLLNRAEEMQDKGITFTPRAQAELEQLFAALREIVDLSVRSYTHTDLVLAARVEPLEQTIDQMCDLLKDKHIERLKTNQCTIDAGIIFLNLLTHLERVADHCSNVAALVMGNELDVDELFDMHALRKRLHAGYEEQYNSLLHSYQLKYLTFLNEEN